MVEYLLAKDCKLHVVDADQWTPLHFASAKGHLQVIQLFQSQGIDIQQFIRMKTNTGASCLHLAVQHGNTNTVKYILSQFDGEALKLLVNEKMELSTTPLHLAGAYATVSNIMCNDWNKS